MLYRDDDLAEPLPLPACGCSMECVLGDGHLIVSNPWHMHLWIEHGVPSKLVRCAGSITKHCHPAVRFDATADALHGVVRNVDDDLARLLMSDAGIARTLGRLEVHGVHWPRPGRKNLTATGLRDLLAIPCALRVRVPHGAAIGVAGFAALPPRSDVSIEGLVPDRLISDCMAALPRGWAERVRLLPVPASRGAPHSKGRGHDIDTLLSRIDSVLNDPSSNGTAP